MIEGSIKTAFSEGEFLSEREAQRIIDTLIDDQVGVQRYTDLVKDGKVILNRMVKIGPTVLYVQDDGSMTDAQKLTLVRLINLAKKGEYLVVVGDEVCYLPRWIRGASSETIRHHVQTAKTIGEERSNTSLIQSFKNNIRTMYLVWTSPI